MNFYFDETLEKQLDSNCFFYRFESTLGRMYQALEDKKINTNNTNQEIFCNDIFCKILDEGAGFISCLKSSSFFSALHHTRALIEIYSLVSKSFSNEINFEKHLNRYINFKKVIIYNRIQEQIRGINNWGLSQEFIEQNNNIHPDSLKKHFKISSRKDLSKIKSWTGKAKIKDFLSSLPSENYINNYDVLCYYTHPTGFRNRDVVGGSKLPSSWEESLFATAKYFFDSLSCLTETNFLSKSSKDSVREILYDIVGDLHAKFVSKKIAN
ncbi:MAG: hypothetical protein ACRDDW_00395 [Candidatus Rhabdochlamydia sp.]